MKGLEFPLENFAICSVSILEGVEAKVLGLPLLAMQQIQSEAPKLEDKRTGRWWFESDKN